MKAELVPENGDPPIPIVRDLTLLGRHEDCDVVIGHPSLSKRHCLLVKTDGLLVIRDLATTNGTKVKGQRVRWAALLPEDRVSFGAYKMRIYLGSDEMPSPSESSSGSNARRRFARRQPAATGGKDSPASSAKTELSPPSQRPAMVPQGFPEPSHDGSGPDWDSIDADDAGQPSAAPAPALKNGGFEIVEETRDADSGGVFEGGFELVDDDDDESSNSIKIRLRRHCCPTLAACDAEGVKPPARTGRKAQPTGSCQLEMTRGAMVRPAAAFCGVRARLPSPWRKIGRRSYACNSRSCDHESASGLIGTSTTLLAPRRLVEAVNLARVVGLQSARLAIFALNGVVHLLAVHGDLDWGRDSQSNLIAANIHHGDDDVIADDDTFIAVTRQDQHWFRLLPPASEARDRP